MYRIFRFNLLLITLCFLCTHLYGQKDTKRVVAGNEAIKYYGRVQMSADSSVCYNWSGVYFETVFTGGHLSILASDTDTSYYNVFIDGRFRNIVKIWGQNEVIPIISGLDVKPHLLRLQKRSEGEFGQTTIHHFLLKSGAKLMANTAQRSRFVEFIGDSFTCGYGVDGKQRDDPFLVKEENCDKGFACILARHFDADYALVAHSGRGVSRNYGDSVSLSGITMKDLMQYTFDSKWNYKWDYKSYRPDLVVINLGSNDFSTQPQPSKEGFISAYSLMINQLRSGYGDVPILCVVPRQTEPIGSYMSDLMNILGDKNIYITGSLAGVMNNTTDMGAAWHPGYSGQRKMAMFLIPYISTIMGWELENKPII